MEKKINLEEILVSRFPHLKGFNKWDTFENYIGKSGDIYKYVSLNDIYELMKDVCNQILKLAAENAEIRVVENAVIEEGTCYDVYDDGVFTIFADKQSILNIINQIE